MAPESDQSSAPITLRELAIRSGLSYSQIRLRRDRGELGPAWDGKRFDLAHPQGAVPKRRRKWVRSGENARVDFTCAFCGGPGATVKRLIRARNFCKKECYFEAQKQRTAKRRCKGCGELFAVRRIRNGARLSIEKYCKDSCRTLGTTNRRTVPCEVCGEPVEIRASDVGRVQRCVSCRGHKMVRVGETLVSRGEVAEKLGISINCVGNRLSRHRARLDARPKVLTFSSWEAVISALGGVKAAPTIEVGGQLLTIAELAAAADLPNHVVYARWKKGKSFDEIIAPIGRRGPKPGAVRHKDTSVVAPVLTQSQLARVAGVSRAAVSRAVRGTLKEAFSGGVVDVSHPSVMQFIQRRR